jgi:hypothetical protein
MIKKRLKIPKGGNQNPYIEEEQTTQWPKEKVHRDKQRSTKHTHKTKDQVTRTPLKTWSELRCSVRVSGSCSTSGTRRVNLVTNPVISHEWGKDREVFTNINKTNNHLKFNLSLGLRVLYTIQNYTDRTLSITVQFLNESVFNFQRDWLFSKYNESSFQNREKWISFWDKIRK